MQILNVQSSARKEGSVSRSLSDELIAKLNASGGANIVTRDVADGLPFVNEGWIAANFTPADQRDEGHKATLALSDELVTELKAADTLVIGVPIYNFGVPAALKAWVDLVARAGLTFRYTENGPVGLLEDKKVYLVVASGGTEAQSAIDYAVPYMRHVLSFIGLTDVELIAADQLMIDAEASMAKAHEAISKAA